MHKLFYGIGGLLLLPAAYFAFRSFAGGSFTAMQWALCLILAACLWMGLGRGLHLLQRLADALAPEAPPEPQRQALSDRTPQDRARMRGI